MSAFKSPRRWYVKPLWQLQQLDLLLKAKKKGGKSAPMGDVTHKTRNGQSKAHAFCVLWPVNRRRELIVQPDKNEEFKVLCSYDHPETDNLFSDDLRKW